MSGGTPAVAKVRRGVADHLAGALEAEAHRHLHALARGVGRRRRPAGAQRRKEIADGVEIVVGLLIFRGLVLRRHGLDRQLQILAVGIVDLGNAGPVVEHAAKRRRARPVVEHAAGRMRKRRGIDRGAALGVGGAQAAIMTIRQTMMRRSMRRALRVRSNQLDASWPGSRRTAFTSPRSWRQFRIRPHDVIARQRSRHARHEPGGRAFQRRSDHREAAAYWVPRFRGGRQSSWAAACPPYAFFFTSLTLENVMPSARSLV